MVIAILTRDPNLYANQRFSESARARRLNLHFINPLQSLMPDWSIDPIPDAVIARYTPRWQQQGDTALRALQARGVFALNKADAIALARHMPSALRCIQAAGLPMPETRFYAPGAALNLAELPFGLPMLIKREYSTHGEGVDLVRTQAELYTAAAKHFEQGFGFYLQAFISESNGVDVRLLVAGGRVLAAMKRTAKPGEFRANIHLGAKPKAHTATSYECELACKAAAAFDLPMAGVDLILSKNGPLLLEVNACPGFEGLEQVSAVDIAGQILDLLISRQNRESVGVNNQNIR